MHFLSTDVTQGSKTKYRDEVCYEPEDQYFFGEDILFALITGQNVNTGKICDGKVWLECEVSLEKFIAFVKEGCEDAEAFFSNFLTQAAHS